MSKKSLRTYLAWVVVSPLVFAIGSKIGATTGGVVPSLVPGLLGLILGDCLFGATIGLGQLAVLRHVLHSTVSQLWIHANWIGFTVGARLGAMVTYPVASDWLPPSVVFGAVMGTCIGALTSWALPGGIGWRWRLGWVVICLLAWTVGERVSFANGFSPASAPLVGLVIGGVTGAGVLVLGSLLDDPCVRSGPSPSRD